MNELTLEDVLEQKLKDPEFRKEYIRTRPQALIVDQIISARCKMGLTQKQLADLIGTKKSAISRIENGKTNPTLETLLKISKALDCSFTISAR